MPFDVIAAIAFNQRRLAAGELVPADLAYLVRYFQEGRGLDPDGMAGTGETIPSIRRYVAAILAARDGDAPAPLADWVFPVPALHGRRAVISNGFGADRDVDPATGEPKRKHGGVDITYPRDSRGERKYPDYDYGHFMPSAPEIPILSSGPGEVIIAGEGRARNGQKVIEIVVDYGDAVPSVGTLAIEHLHCKRLLVARGAVVATGQPIAIVGATATKMNHDHAECWGDRDGDKKPERADKINPAPLFRQMKHADYRPPPGLAAFDPQYLAA